MGKATNAATIYPASSGRSFKKHAYITRLNCKSPRILPGVWKYLLPDWHHNEKNRLNEAHKAGGLRNLIVLKKFVLMAWKGKMQLWQQSGLTGLCGMA